MISETLNTILTNKNDINELKKFEKRKYLQLNQRLVQNNESELGISNEIEQVVQKALVIAKGDAYTHLQVKQYNEVGKENKKYLGLEQVSD